MEQVSIRTLLHLLLDQHDRKCSCLHTALSFLPIELQMFGDGWRRVWYLCMWVTSSRTRPVSSSSIVSFLSWWLKPRLQVSVPWDAKFSYFFGLYFWNDRNDGFFHLFRTIRKEVITSRSLLSHLLWSDHYTSKWTFPIDLVVGSSYIDNLFGVRNGLSIHLLFFCRSGPRTIKGFIC